MCLSLVLIFPIGLYAQSSAKKQSQLSQNEKNQKSKQVSSNSGNNTHLSVDLNDLNLANQYQKRQRGKTFSFKEVYELAKKHNATYQAALANFQANETKPAVNLGQLLPSITLGLFQAYNKQFAPDTGSNQKDGFFEGGGDNDLPNVAVEQSIFDWSLWQSYAQSQYQLKADTITLAKAQQNLILKTNQAYFNVILAIDNLRFTKASVEWNQLLYKQNQNKLEAGTVDITDLESSKARLKSSIADYVDAVNQLENAYTKLYNLTGQKIQSIYGLKKAFPFQKPDPADLDKWQSISKKNNLDVVQKQFLVQVADKQISIAWGEFLPEAKVSAEGYRKLDYQNANHTSGLSEGQIKASASWNVLNGGSDYANLKQKEYAKSSAEFELKQAERQTISQITQQYLNVLSDISQIKAFKQSVQANLASLKAMKRGFEVGTKTIVDLLNQQRQLLNAQQQYAQAKFNYINDLFQLKAEAGVLNSKDVEKLNQWIDQSAPAFQTGRQDLINY
jgi:outer membrane protein